MTDYKISDEIVCYCSKCKLELNARIVRVEAEKPKRVLCLTCNIEHAYRKSAPVKAGEGKARKKQVPNSQVEQEELWRKKISQPDKALKSYDMEKVYLLDDYVDHQIFGVGLVVSLLPPNKINVFFQDGLKMMRCG